MSEPVPVDPLVVDNNQDVSANRLIGIGLLTRLLTDTAVQIFFPFLPIIAGGIGVSAAAMGRLVSLRSAMGLLAPLFGLAADARGYRTVMRLGLLLSAIGYFVIASSSALWLTAVGMVLAGLGTFSFVPTLQAYVSSKLAYDKRARGLGVLEYSWALSGIIGLFLVGFMIEMSNWRVPFYLISVGLLLSFFFYRRLPASGSRTEPGAPHRADVVVSRLSLNQLKAFFYFGEHNRSAWAVLVAAMLSMFAAMVVFINYGYWLSTEYGLSGAQLGTVALVIGLADLCGSVTASLTGDRMGTRRALLLATIVGIVAYAALPLFNQSVVLAVTGMVLVRVAFEFSVVNNLALLSEQVPEERARVMSMGTAMALLGASLAGLAGVLIYENFGVAGLATVAIASLVLILIIVLRYAEEAPGRELPGQSK